MLTGASLLIGIEGVWVTLVAVLIRQPCRRGQLANLLAGSHLLCLTSPHLTMLPASCFTHTSVEPVPVAEPRSALGLVQHDIKMADPLSITGVAISVVSLGLQVSGAIINYIDALDSRDEEIMSLKQQSTLLQRTLGVIDTCLP